MDTVSDIAHDALVAGILGGVGGGTQVATNGVRQSNLLGNATKRLVSNENIARYRSVIDSVFSGNYPSNAIIQMGDTPEILLQHGASQYPLTLTQKAAYKIAYPDGYFGGRHNLGMSVLKQLPYQIADPIAILRSNTQNDSLVLLTKWKDGGKDIIIPKRWQGHSPTS